MTHSDQSKPTTQNFHMLKVKTIVCIECGDLVSITELETESDDEGFVTLSLGQVLEIHTQYHLEQRKKIKCQED